LVFIVEPGPRHCQVLGSQQQSRVQAKKNDQRIQAIKRDARPRAQTKASGGRAKARGNEEPQWAKATGNDSQRVVRVRASPRRVQQWRGKETEAEHRQMKIVRERVAVQQLAGLPREKQEEL